mmetsp:Transcript_5212/g.15450  ORF Transcript_5212/g.15450 Transcript_5212/m.15450 type:complete len:249 (-) Transcript_5212:34-780(-)
MQGAPLVLPHPAPRVHLGVDSPRRAAQGLLPIPLRARVCALDPLDCRVQLLHGGVYGGRRGLHGDQHHDPCADPARVGHVGARPPDLGARHPPGPRGHGRLLLHRLQHLRRDGGPPGPVADPPGDLRRILPHRGRRPADQRGHARRHARGHHPQHPVLRLGAEQGPGRDDDGRLAPLHGLQRLLRAPGELLRGAHALAGGGPPHDPAVLATRRAALCAHGCERALVHTFACSCGLLPWSQAATAQRQV